MDDTAFFAGLRPELATLARKHRDACRAAHLHVQFESGYRAPAVQDALYRHGRQLTEHGWVVVDPHAVVTNATADRSPHCRGAAYDLWLLFGHAGEDHLRNATMDPKDGWGPAEIEQQTTLWGAVVRIGTELGLVAGASWPRLRDFPHFEIKGWRELPLKEN
jgi:hypothetical protein